MIELPQTLSEGTIFLLSIFGLALTILTVTIISHRRKVRKQYRYLMKYLALGQDNARRRAREAEKRSNDEWKAFQKRIEMMRNDFS